MPKKAIILILCLVFLSGCSIFPKEEDALAPPLISPKEVTYSTVKAKLGDIKKTVMVNATFEAVLQENLSFELRSGYLKEVYCNMGDKVKKGQKLFALDTDELAGKIENQRISVEKARLIYEREKAKVGNDKYAIKLAELDYKSAQIMLENYNKELSKCVIFAPFDGIVLSMPTIEIGGMVKARETLATVANPSSLKLAYTGKESGSFKTGSEVTIEYSGQKFSGVVSSAPDSAPLGADGKPNSKVIIRLNKVPKGAKIGGTAKVSAVLEHKEGVVIVQSNALVEYGGTFYVNVLEDKVKKERPVQVGIKTETEAEIVKGLSKDELVIIR